MKNKIKFESPTVADRSILRYELQTQLKQVPNDKTFIFFRPRLWFYYRQQERGDTTDFDKFIERKLVEPPSLYSRLNSEESVEAMREHLFNRGYLEAQVWYTDTVREQKVYVTYHIKPNKLFRVASYDLSAPDSTVQQILQKSKEESFLKPGVAVSNTLLYSEKQRIIKELHQNGFANISLGNFSSLEATDTTNGQVKIQLRLLPAQAGKFNQKYIGNVTVNNRFVQESISFSKPALLDSILFQNFNTRNQIRPTALLDYIKLRPGNLYKKDDLALTRTQLQLPAVQFADITTIPRQDSSNIVDFQIDLLPAKRIETNMEVELNRTTVSSESFIGLGTNLGLVNNNFLGGSERLSNILDISFEVDPALSGIFNAANFNFSNTLEIPRYAKYLGIYKTLNNLNILPTEKYDRLKSNGSSIIELTYEYVDLFNFFNYHSLTAEYGFRSSIPSSVGRKRLQIVHPSLTYFDPTIRPDFDSLYSDQTFARKSFAPQLFTSIFFNRISYTFERFPVAGGFSSALIGNFEVSGVEIYLANLVANGLSKPFNIGNLAFAQYAKLEVDGRIYKQLGGEQALAFRANVGFSSPFGTSEVIPFVKQYNLGGPLSMRAWRIRELGPGSYRDSTLSSGNFPFFQTGDIKLLFNAEYRFDVFWRIEGAFFLDAGNVWTIKDDGRPGSTFSKNFLSDIAVGSGAGMRFDADYFKIVLDVGLKLRNPFRNEFGYYSALRGSPPLNEVINWNFAINYPF